ncbi:PREDICTED: protein arginine N-methyltransferase 7 [Ceratosolen solmsi marchali]|uniref:Protein arginine N-methyltransferase n=1 Tax=Ceratosolen solmsi marchali TaxID=326594 RepID=A0AAJ6YU30_9HYME|nr:PREDICTED: protein arginine N-methyltransferase 7 [Ceratosolen solmsi marchali]
MLIRNCLLLDFRQKYRCMCKMSIFTQNINPITGLTSWEERDPDYDYYQEIARSAFADMLHDHERNYKYYLGIKAAIDKKHKAKEEANVLDIGTGTGLLSMMAAKCGADSIVACETFKPIAECAKRIIDKNGFSNKIKLIYKRSTKLTVGKDGDLLKRANILVTEVFDTELIGEGALSTFKHAQDFLLEKDSIVVPSSGTIWVQVVESHLVKGWNRVNPIKYKNNEENLIEAPDITQVCSGASAVHDIQLSQLPEGSFNTLIEPQPIFKFDWTGKIPLKFNDNVILPVKPIAKGIAHAVFMWWDLNMDMDGQIQLSCAPVWAHPDAQFDLKNGEHFKNVVDKIPWRDHWMQAIYYLPNDCYLSPEKETLLIGSHDEYSFWFSLNNEQKNAIEDFKRPICECCVHLAFSRTRIGQWNDENRTHKYLEALRKKITPDLVCLCLTDTSLLGLSIAKMGIKKLYLLETNSLSRKTVKMFISKNNLDDIVTIIDSIDNLPSSDKINLVFAEPYYVTSILPWDNLHFWYLSSKYSSPHITFIPKRAVIKAVPMEFKDLQKIRANLGICEGLDMTVFDNLVQSSSVKTDSPVEAQPLWEYPGKSLSLPFTIAEFNFNDDVYKQIRINSFQEIPFIIDGVCNGIAIWVNWDLDDDIVVTSGPIEEIIPGSRISWDPYTRQGVQLFSETVHVTNKSILMSSFNFNPEEGRIQFNFELKNK